MPIVFDKLHWQANPRSKSYAEELSGALATWPKNRIPELHYSEQWAGKVRGAHAPYISGGGLLEFADEIAEVAKGREVGIIVEAKRKDLAIARAIGELSGKSRHRLLRHIPDLTRAPRDWVARSAVLERLFDDAA